MKRSSCKFDGRQGSNNRLCMGEYYEALWSDVITDWHERRMRAQSHFKTSVRQGEGRSNRKTVLPPAAETKCGAGTLRHAHCRCLRARPSICWPQGCGAGALAVAGCLQLWMQRRHCSVSSLLSQHRSPCWGIEGHPLKLFGH